MYKDSLDKQASCLFLILPLCFLFPVFFAQVEVEADIREVRERVFRRGRVIDSVLFDFGRQGDGRLGAVFVVAYDDYLGCAEF